MKKIIIWCALFYASISFATGGDHGNSGDAMRSLFNQARNAAIQRVNELQWCSFESNVPQELSEWLINKREEIAADIASSQYYWVVDGQVSCGFTQRKLGAPIYLSYPTCASTVATNLTSAIFVVLHETAHHFGIDDEDRADEIAEAILRTNSRADCSKPVDDVFNQRICQGLPFTKADGLKYVGGHKGWSDLGTYKTYGRYRDCIRGGPCDAWTAAAPNISGFDLTIDRENEFPGYSIHPEKYIQFQQIESGYSILTTAGAPVYAMTPFTPKFEKFKGGVYQSCVWLKSNLKSAGRGLYYREGEFVIYGKHNSP